MQTYVQQSSVTTSKQETVYRVNPIQLAEIEDVLRNILELRRASFEPIMSVDDIIYKIQSEMWYAYIFVDENKDIFGMMAVSLRRTGQDTLVMILEFTTLDEFFRLARMYEVIETLARQLGCKYIEAVVHPTIAEYAVKKKGFTAPNVHVRKAISYERMM